MPKCLICASTGGRLRTWLGYCENCQMAYDIGVNEVLVRLYHEGIKRGDPAVIKAYDIIEKELCGENNI